MFERRSASGRSVGRGHEAQLLEHAELVLRGPVLDGLAVGEPVDVDRLSTGEYTTIDFPGAIQTGVGGTNVGLNARGDIVGDYCAVDPQCRTFPLNGSVHGFLLRGGEFSTIDVPGALATSAVGINARGDIVGIYNVDATRPLGFLLTKTDRSDEGSDQ